MTTRTDLSLGDVAASIIVIGAGIGGIVGAAQGLKEALEEKTDCAAKRILDVIAYPVVGAAVGAAMGGVKTAAALGEVAMHATLVLAGGIMCASAMVLALEHPVITIVALAALSS